MAREAMDVCLRELKESNKSRFDSYSVKNSVLIISHITFRDCRVHFFSDNFSRNSGMLVTLTSPLTLGKSMFLSRVKERPQGSGERELKSPTHPSPYISCLISSLIVFSKTWANISSHLPDLAIIIALNCESTFLNKNLFYFKR